MERGIWKDRIHLNKGGITKIADNIKAINTLHTWRATPCQQTTLTNAIFTSPNDDNTLHDGDNSNLSNLSDRVPSKILNDVRLKNRNHLTLAHLNINQIVGKFEALKEIIQENLDILAISESKLDQS